MKSGHEHFNGSLVVPVLDEQGQVTEVYGRKIRDDLRPGTPKHLYLPGPHVGVFNLAGVQEAGRREPGQREVILCEALMDAMTFWVHGFHNVTSSYGIEGFTDDILQSFKANGIERVLMAYDRDAPGKKAVARLAPLLMAQGFEVLQVLFPPGMDANAFACTMATLGDSPGQALALVLRQAQWVGGVRAVQVEVQSQPQPQPQPAVPSFLAAPDRSNDVLVAGGDRLRLTGVASDSDEAYYAGIIAKAQARDAQQRITMPAMAAFQT